MTTTMFRPETTTRSTSGADQLLDLMHDTLAVVADDADSFDGRTPTGQVLVSLATLGRQAGGAVGGGSRGPPSSVAPLSWWCATSRRPCSCSTGPSRGPRPPWTSTGS